MIKAVVFDVGETLVDETSQWHAEANRLGLTPLTFFAALGAVIERGEDHRGAWRLVGKEHPTLPRRFTAADLYPDAVPCLRRLVTEGYAIGVAGNQPEHAEEVLRAIDAPIDFVASSARWGIEKPSAMFFQRICDEAELPADSIAYVGDRLDNDILPARHIGMFAVFIRRGPWGHIHANRPEAANADARIDSLNELSRSLLDPADSRHQRDESTSATKAPPH